MKAILKILVLTLAILMSVITITAAEVNKTKNNNFEVTPPEDTIFTEIQQKNIIDYLTKNKELPVSKGLTCILFGHDTAIERWTLTYHKEHASAPRCIRNVYDVSACSRCDYMASDLVLSIRVFCCS